MSTFNVNELLKALDNEEHKQLLNINSEKIAKDKNDILQQLQLSREELKKLHTKLTNYRYIDELNDLNYGQYLRWINISNPDKLYLTTGGLFVDLKLLDSGTHIVCKNRMHNIFQIKLDESIIFQKISDQEAIIIQALDYVKT
jgi:hypothetical protein